MSIKSRLTKIAAALGCVQKPAYLADPHQAGRVRLIEEWIEEQRRGVRDAVRRKQRLEQALRDHDAAVRETLLEGIEELQEAASSAVWRYSLESPGSLAERVDAVYDELTAAVEELQAAATAEIQRARADVAARCKRQDEIIDYHNAETKRLLEQLALEQA